MVTSNVKQCRVCKLVQPVEAFVIRAETGRRRTECRTCLNERSSAYYWNNREAEKAKRKRFRDENPEHVKGWRKPEVHKAYMKAYHAREFPLRSCLRCRTEHTDSYCQECNRRRVAQYKRDNVEWTRASNALYRQRYPEKFNLMRKRWREQYPERMDAARAGWRAANKERLVTLSHRRRARILEADGTHDDVDWQGVVAMQNGACIDCGSNAAKLTRGHLVPFARGGTNWIENIVGQCQSCNSTQHANIHPLAYERGLWPRAVPSDREP